MVPHFVGLQGKTEAFAMIKAMTERLETNSCVCGFHIYQDRWIPFIRERQECRRGSAITVLA